MALTVNDIFYLNAISNSSLHGIHAIFNCNLSLDLYRLQRSQQNGKCCPFPINISIQCLTIGCNASICFQFHGTHPKIPYSFFYYGCFIPMLLTRNTRTNFFLVKASIIQFYLSCSFLQLLA